MASVSWKGMDQLQNLMQEKAKLNAVKKLVKLNGSELQQKAMQRVPVDTGTLKRSIRLDMEADGLRARVTANTEYAAYVEWGTRFMTARPYMRPSEREQQAQFESDLKRLVK